MTGTNALAAKRALFDRFKQLTNTGGLLADVQVAYAFPGPTNTSRRCVYGGGARFEQVEDATDGNGDTLKLEVATVGVYVEVVRDVGEDDIELADVDAEAIGDILGGIVGKEQNLTGGHGAITGGAADYEQYSSTVRVVHSYTVTVTSYLKP